MGDANYKRAARAIKAAGLQKLRWYCQVCQKQCRDDNGFKCHTMSESHQRMMEIVGANAESFINDYSSSFKRGFMAVLGGRFRKKRVWANKVYVAYIGDRDHVHLNATKWNSVIAFLKEIAEEGLILLEDTPKGPYITFIDRDPEIVRQQEARLARQKQLETDEAASERRIREQRAAAAALEAAAGVGGVETVATELDRDKVGGEKVAFALAAATSTADAAGDGRRGTKRLAGDGSGGISDDGPTAKRRKAGSRSGSGSSSASSSSSAGRRSGKKKDKKKKKGKKKDKKKGKKKDKKKERGRQSGHATTDASKPMSNLERVMAEQERAKEAANRKDYWLKRGLIVKVLNSTVADGEYYKRKGEVVNVVDRYVGEVDVDGDVLRLDQDDLETVLPGIGKEVLVVNGAYRGEVATLDSVDTGAFTATVTIKRGVLNGRTVPGLAYADICKMSKAKAAAMRDAKGR